MSASDEFIKKLGSAGGAGGRGFTLTPAAAQRLRALVIHSPLYRSFLETHPETISWLENPHNRDATYRRGAFFSEWKAFSREHAAMPNRFDRLRTFRRKMSLRIAYRELNARSEAREVQAELTQLAEFCLTTVTEATLAKWTKRLGTPWDGERDQPARFCVLGLGKLGAGELNFCSDIDLMFVYEGLGQCRKEERGQGTANAEFFSRIAREISTLLNERTYAGFLYNVDLRLRPEGAGGPLVRTPNSLESYYWEAGQAWERFALIRARPVAGDLSLGEELFESINAFRYPRHPPPAVLAEIAGQKARMEREVAADDQLGRNIKSGYGGIREVEFFVQGLQFLNGGRIPFLQTGSTYEALDRLVRYELLERSDQVFLTAAYTFLRVLENRLQMRSEEQTHSLPEAETGLRQLAVGLGFEDVDRFDEHLASIRSRIHEIYLSLFGKEEPDEELEAWIQVLSGGEPSPAIWEKLDRWFGPPRDTIPPAIRNFVLGGPHHLLTREKASLYVQLAAQFDTVLRPLAHPLRTLGRISSFARRYGSRMQFFKACSENPAMFEALSLLFDRSEFIHDLLSRHPEIVEEVLGPNAQRSKDARRIEQEIARLPQDESFANWLWTYVRAEQVRLAIAEVLTLREPEEIEAELSHLADGVLSFALRRVDPEASLAIVALGKYGSQESAFGSDLDILVLAEEGSDPENAGRKVQALLRLVQQSRAGSRIFDIDLRLRPHGKDGPLVSKPETLLKYHQGAAQTWERQMLTRARPVAGNEQLQETFVKLRDQLVFARPLSATEAAEIWTMRLRIEKEKGRPLNDSCRAFKAGRGGLVDLEFLVQLLQMKYGVDNRALRSPNTRNVLRLLTLQGTLEPTIGQRLQENYNFLRKLEFYVRREKNRGIAEIDSDPDQERSIARWLGFSSFETFWEDHCARMQQNRALLLATIEKEFGLTAPVSV